VLWVPFFASTGDGCPTHCGHSAQAPRPARGTLLMAYGSGPQVQPSRSAAAPNASRHASEGSAGMGYGRRRGGRAAVGPSDGPQTPISHSTRS